MNCQKNMPQSGSMGLHFPLGWKLEFKIHENGMGLFPGRAKRGADAEVQMGEIMKTQLPRERRKTKARALRVRGTNHTTQHGPRWNAQKRKASRAWPC